MIAPPRHLFLVPDPAAERDERRQQTIGELSHQVMNLTAKLKAMTPRSHLYPETLRYRNRAAALLCELERSVS
jgi:hypothetical protein